MSIDPTAVPSDSAAMWSAVAASFSALAAYLSWRAQIKTLRHTFRPEVIVSGWHRLAPGEGPVEELRFDQVRNTGRDTALHIFVNASGETEERKPTYVCGTVNVPSLTSGERSAVDGRIVIFWQNVEQPKLTNKRLKVQVIVRCWDNLGVRHSTEIALILSQDVNVQIGNVAGVGPGIFVLSQVTKSVPVWVLKLQRRLRSLPLVRALVPGDA